MKIKKVFIIVPALVNDSPIKGACALANTLTESVSVTVVSLRQGIQDFTLLNDCVQSVSLEDYSWFGKIKSMNKMLTDAGGKNNVASISSSFSADFLNSFCLENAITCASVRGNLPVAYFHTYGLFGKLLAYFHLKRLTKFNYAVSMTQSMSNQVSFYVGRNSPVIGNFIDENRMSKYRNYKTLSNHYRFIFTGSFSELKQPLLLVQAASDLKNRDIQFVLDMFGDGPLLGAAKLLANELGVSNNIVFHGHVDEPYKFISKADVLIIPSLSEGIPRSVLEALCLGVPCILRNVDGNNELIEPGVNGELFNNPSELPNLMIEMGKKGQITSSKRRNLIPNKFRQGSCVKAYLNLISG